MGVIEVNNILFKFIKCDFLAFKNAFSRELQKENDIKTKIEVLRNILKHYFNITYIYCSN
jgi:uncharacterized protein YeaO (DUF488 family)